MRLSLAIAVSIARRDIACYAGIVYSLYLTLHLHLSIRVGVLSLIFVSRDYEAA